MGSQPPSLINIICDFLCQPWQDIYVVATLCYYT
eukprot:UN08955